MRLSTRARSGSLQLDPSAGFAPPGRKSAAEAGNFDSLFASSATADEKSASTGKPRSASVIAGLTSSAQGFVPNFWCSAHKPATLPGTPAARCPVIDRSVTLPCWSRYMFRVAAAGAVSRKSSAAACPLTEMTANPPPPTLPADGSVTASANAVATAASTAVPPPRSTSAPTRLASGESLTTTPCLATTSGAVNGYGHAAGTDGAAAFAAGIGPRSHPLTTSEAATRKRRNNLPTIMEYSPRRAVRPEPDGGPHVHARRREVVIRDLRRRRADAAGPR